MMHGKISPFFTEMAPTPLNAAKINPLSIFWSAKKIEGNEF